MPDTSSRPEAGQARNPVLGESAPQLAWVVLGLLGAAFLVTMPRWAAIAFYLAWVGFGGLYGWGAWRWHRLSAENQRLLAVQQGFIQDASHQLKTPITIALGHAELVARELAGQEGQRDIDVVVGELNRLKRLSDRLLLIAASQNPDFLRPEPLDLGLFAAEVAHRWQPTAPRRWRIGQLDEATVSADADRLALVVDALLENAVQHTGEGDLIRLSVTAGERARFASVTIEDSGSGIPAAELSHIFDRFRSGHVDGGPRGTGLGLALVQAVTNGHGGEVRVHSELGAGSRFEVVLPVVPAPATPPERQRAAPTAPAGPGGRR